MRNPPAARTTGGAFARALPATLGASAVGSALYLGWLIAGAAGAIAALASVVGALALPRAIRAARRRTWLRPVLVPSRDGAELGTITEEVGIGYAAVHRNGHILVANRIFLKLVGAAKHEGLFADQFSAHDRPAIDAAMAMLLGGESKLQDLRLEPLAHPGQPVLITMGYAARYERLFVITKDDSLQLRLEAQMRQATKMEAVGQLAGGLAHDFNNILTAIIGHCDLMLMRHGPGDIDHHDAEQIRQNANRAADLVRQLLAFSRQQTLRTRVVQIADVVGEISHLLRRLLGETVRLNVSQGSGLPPVRVDPGQIEQVLVNLAVNARDAMPSGGLLSISTYAVAAADVAALDRKIMPHAEYVAISVSDTGTGIAPAVLNNVFDPFFTTKDQGKGTGLGLSMAYGIVKQSGGFIFVDSAPSRGTRFEIYLPAAIGERVETPATVAAPALEGWGQGTILLVEDEAMVRAVAARALTRSGYHVLTAQSGEEALAIMANEPDIDLLISDVVMLGMDGPTLVNRARAARPDLRALFISGYAEEQIRTRVDDPSTPLLRKPFSIQELSAAVRARLAA